MPDLSLEASAQYWFDFVDPTIYRVITFLESVENWTLDGNPDFEREIKQLGKELDAIEHIDMSTLAHEEHFVRILANIRSGRGLRLLQAIDTTHPGSASKVLIYAEENSMSGNRAATVFLQRNIAFERLRLLSRVFSQDRLKLVARALEGEE